MVSREATERWGIAAVLLAYAVLAVLMVDHVDDDTFIYFRTAANIANGHGYVFNAGGERIETGSSLVWQFLLAGAYLLHLDLLAFSKIAGLLLGGAALYVLWLISRRIIDAPGFRVLPSLLLTVTIPFYGWVQRGLETSLYVFSIVLLAWFLVCERLRRLWYLPALLVVLSRSEGFLVLPALIGFLYFERRELRLHVRNLAVVALVLFAVSVWRFVYFHDFVPHPFYLKINEIPGLPLTAAWLYFKATGTLLFLAGAALGLRERRVWNRDLIALAVLDVPFLWWGIRTCTLVEYHRYLAPAFPLLYVVAVRGLDVVAAKGRNIATAVHSGVVAFVLWLAFFAPAFSFSLNATQNLLAAALTRFAVNPAGFVARTRTVVSGGNGPPPPGQESPDGIATTWAYTLGEFIAKNYPQGITVVFDQMGQTPWYSGLDKTFIDTLGLTYRPGGFAHYNDQLAAHGNAVQFAYRALCDRVFGPRPWTNDQAVDRIFSLKPELVVFGFFTDPSGQGVGPRILRDPRLAANYVERPGPFVRLFERKKGAASSLSDARSP